MRGGNASFTVGGAGGRQTTWNYGGNGGGGCLGTNGENGVSGKPPSPQAIGGAAGEATRGTITWINRGDIRGATV